MASSPIPAGFNSLQEEIEYYKRQYEHLESELQDFQASSRELEAELEKDIEASEKRERNLKEKVEGLSYEVDEWKVSCSDQYLRAVLTMLILHFICIDEIQTVEIRGKQCPEQPSKRNHSITRNKSDSTVTTAGY